jgi:hypothetical protein
VFWRTSGRDPIGRRQIFLSDFRSGKGAWVLTLEVLRTSRVWRISKLRCKGIKFPKVSGSEVNLDHSSVKTRVHRSR